MKKFNPDPKLYPFGSNWVQLSNGNKIHYLDEGSGPVLLLLHGNPAWSFLYRKIVPRLRSRFRCIAPDLPGFGLSTVGPRFGFTAQEQIDVVVELLDKLNLNDVGVMMQDWGGPIGLRAAQLRPDRISRFIIGNTWGWPFDRMGPKVFSAIMGGLAGRFGAYVFNGVVRWFFTVGVVNKLPADVWRMYHAPFRTRASRKPTHVFPMQLTSAAPLLREIERDTPEISHKPALILWGDRDFAFKEWERARFRNAFPNHRDITLHGAGHFIQEDAPEEICTAIEAWHDDLTNNLPA